MFNSFLLLSLVKSGCRSLMLFRVWFPEERTTTDGKPAFLCPASPVVGRSLVSDPGCSGVHCSGSCFSLEDGAALQVVRTARCDVMLLS